MLRLVRLDEPPITLKRPWQPDHSSQAVSPVPAMLVIVACILGGLLADSGSRARTHLFTPVALAAALHSLVVTTSTDYESASLRAHVVAPWTLSLIALGWTSDPPSEFKLDGQRATPPPWTRARLYWALHLFVSPRGVGWNCRAKGVPLAPNVGRLRYVGHCLFQAVVGWLVFDFAVFLTSYNPYFLSRGDLPLSSLSLFQRLAFPVVFLTSLLFSIRFNFFLAAAVCVGTGLSPVEAWPDITGSICEATSVQRFWGRTWHLMQQTFRRNTRPLLRAFPSVDPHLVLLFSSFIQSALYHGLDNYAIGRQFHLTALSFLLQPVAILLERALAPTLRIRIGLPRALGYLWTAIWLCASFTPMVVEVARCGHFAGPDDPVPFSRWSPFGRSQAFLSPAVRA